MRYPDMTRWIRFSHDGTPGFGVLDGEEVAVHTGSMFDAPVPTGTRLRLDQIALLPPVAPGKFIGLWNNFHELAAKQGHAVPATPLFFLKAPSSLVAHGADIRPPTGYDGRIVYEGELGLVIGRVCAGLDEAGAEAAIFGLTCVNDVTATDILTADPAFPQWTRAKSADGFGPVGPVVATGLDWRTLRVRTALNGRMRQDYAVSDMILPPARIVALLSREMTLHPGDLIACGTSVGVLPMRAGQVVEVSIDGIGVLRNSLAARLPA
jgi:2-keto-4-pentenoate hydratase/2-oxohepta-3-ene-1,7-dioic acid hydratase in catechol pathway